MTNICNQHHEHGVHEMMLATKMSSIGESDEVQLVPSIRNTYVHCGIVCVLETSLTYMKGYTMA